jgi:hypothetical protein
MPLSSAEAVLGSSIGLAITTNFKTKATYLYAGVIFRGFELEVLQGYLREIRPLCERNQSKQKTSKALFLNTQGTIIELCGHYRMSP